MTTLALVWDLIATDNASSVLKKVGVEASATAKETESLGKKFSKLGGSIALAAVGVAVVSTKMAADFQEATTLLVTGAGESEKSLAMVRSGLLAMAPAVGIGPTALAKAMFMVESAGYHGADGLIVMKAAAEGAKIGGADATVVANGLTTALTDYHLPASKAAEITSKLVATVSAGKTNMGDLTASLSGILPFASSLGVKFNDITGAMATMTGEGIDAANASTMLRFTMMSLANETPKGKKALASIGMTAQQLKDDLSSKGVGGALSVVTEQIAKHFPAGSVKATQALAAIAGGTRGMGAALALTGTHAATLIANTKSIASAATEAGGHVKGWKLTSEDLNIQISKLTAFLQQLAVKIGTAVIPVIEKVVTWMTQHKVITEMLAGVIGGVLVAAVVLWTASMVAAGIATLAATWPALLIIAAIAALAAGLVYCWTHFETFRTVVTDVFHAVQVVIGKVVEVIITIFRGMLNTWTTVIGGIISAAANIAEALHLPFARGLRRISDGFNATAKAADDKLREIAHSAGEWGQQAGVKLASGLAGQNRNVQAAAAGLAVGVYNKMNSNLDTYSIGVAASAGLAAGIAQDRGGAVAAAQALGGQVAKSLRLALQVHSPSKVTMEIGRYVGLGLAQGMDSQRGTVAKSAAAMLVLPRVGLDFASSAGRSSVLGGGGFDYDRLAQAMTRVRLTPVISVSSVDSALGAGLR